MTRTYNTDLHPYIWLTFGSYFVQDLFKELDAETDAFFDSLMNEGLQTEVHSLQRDVWCVTGPAETAAVPKAAAFDPPPREVWRQEVTRELV